MNLFGCKANVKRFSFEDLHKDIDMLIVHTAMDACQDYRRKENVYNQKDINMHS